MPDTAERTESERTGEHGHAGEKDKSGALGKVEGKLGKHRDVIVIVVSLLGVLIAWFTYQWIKGGGSSSSATTSPDYTSAGSAGPAGLVAGSGADGGGALDGLSTLLSNMQAELDTLTTTATTKPKGWVTPKRYNSPRWRDEPASAKAHFLFGPAAKGLKFLRDLRTGAIYEVNPNGKLYKLTHRQYLILGKPQTIDYGHPKSSPRPTPKPKPRTTLPRPNPKP